jgi:hypothetical protein
VDSTGKKGELTGKKGELTGKKGELDPANPRGIRLSAPYKQEKTYKNAVSVSNSAFFRVAAWIYPGPASGAITPLRG